MPMFGYKCDTCGHEEDYLVKSSEADATPVCKSCGSDKQSKQISTGTAFLLKGYGWSKNGMNSKKVGKF